MNRVGVLYLGSCLLSSTLAHAATPSQLASLQSALSMEAQYYLTNGGADANASSQLALTLNDVMANPSASQNVLQNTFTAQYYLPNYPLSDPRYGSFSGEDGNTTAFVSLALAVLWNRAHLTLPAAVASDFQNRMSYAGTWLMNNPVSAAMGGVSYTNITLLSAVDMILLGEASGNTTVAAQGYARLSTWYTYTRANGISEFISPAYTATDISALNMGYLFAQNGFEKVRMKAALDYIWSDVKANYFRAQGVLAGAHSRDYDWLQGIDYQGMNLYLLLEAGQNSFPAQGGVMPAGAPANLSTIYLYENSVNSNAYHPVWSELPVPDNSATPSFVSEKFGYLTSSGVSEVGQRTSYANGGFSISSASVSRSWQDKLFNVTLRSAKPGFEQITFSTNSDGNAFGEDDYQTYLSLGGESHNHADINPASAQKDGAVLSTFDFGTSGKETAINTTLILPLAADSILINGNPLPTLTPGQEVAVGKNSVQVEVREGTNGVVMQLSVADSVGGQTPSFGIRLDTINRYSYVENQVAENVASSQPASVLSLVIHHYQGVATGKSQAHVRGAVSAYATAFSSLAQWNSFRATVKAHPIIFANLSSKTSWSASVAPSSSASLAVSRSMSNLTQYTSAVNGAAIANPMFTANGVDITSQLAFFGAGFFNNSYPTSQIVDISAVSWGVNRIDLFGVSSVDHSLQHQAWDGTQWCGWESLGGYVTSKPKAVSWGAGRLDIFMQGGQGQLAGLYHKAWLGSSWSGFDFLGGSFNSEPDVVSWGPNRLDVFVRGTDSQLWHLAWFGQWGNWEARGGVLFSAPKAVAWGPNRIDIFALGGDAGLWHLDWANNAWSGWESLGTGGQGPFTSEPEVVAWAPGRLDIFLRGSAPNYNLIHTAWEGTFWSGFDNLGGTITSAPRAVAWSPNRLDVFARGGNGALYHKAWDGGAWIGYDFLGGELVSTPEVVSWAPGRLDVFSINGDSSVYQIGWSNNAWFGPGDLGGSLIAPVNLLLGM